MGLGLGVGVRVRVRDGVWVSVTDARPSEGVGIVSSAVGITDWV